MVTIYGHRGAAGEAPENTLTGFTYARSIGVRNYEFDIHLTRDGQVAVIHDSSVERTTGTTGIVEEMTMDELRALNACARFPEWPERARIPTLDEVFAVIGDGHLFQIEIKRAAPEIYSSLILLMLDSVERYGLAEQVYVSSFEMLALQTAREQAPGLKRNFITNQPSEAYIQQACDFGCAMASPRFGATTGEIVDRLHAAGLLVCSWCGNDADTIGTMLQWGVDAITTDYPSLAFTQPGIANG